MNHHLRLLLALGIYLLAATSFAADESPTRLRVPEGFVIERVVDEANIRFPMFAAFDDRGRLFVAESSGLDLYAEITAATRKCRVRLLEDRDGDGKFETAKVFADKLVFPMGLAWRARKLYVADPPDLVAYEDHDGDGMADKRTVILSGFGHKDNGSLHGLVFGPDGCLYMTMGTPDGYKLKQRDGSVLEGTSGALIRCRADGSDPEVLCRGFVNLVEVAFTPRGDAIGTDNWFQRPHDGYRDALVHLIDGGLYPYEPDTGTRFPVTGDPLPSMSLFPAVALSGICTYRGGSFPGEMHGNLFTAQHNSRTIARHALVPNGSTFRTENFDFVTTDDPDFHPSDVLEAADGSLIVVDTGSWYVQHCPTGRIRASNSVGGIYRVRAKDAAPPKDPLGQAINWKSASPDTLVQLFSDPRPAVRDRAEQALTGRGKAAVSVLAAVMRGDQSTIARQHAIRTLAAVDDPAALAPLRGALVDRDADVLVPAARALAIRRDRASGDRLAKLLEYPAATVRLAAAEALARCGSARSVPSLRKALAEDPDAFLEHAIVHAIHHLADAGELQSILEESHPRLKRAAMRLLDQPPRAPGLLKSDAVFEGVQSSDTALQRTAMEILARHQEWTDRAVELLRGWLAKDRLSDEERLGLRSLVLAFQGQKSVQDLVAAAIVNRDGKISPAKRTALLAALAECTLPELPKTWISSLSHALAGSDEGMRLQALTTAAVLQIAALDSQINKLADDETASVDVRRLALQAIVQRQPKLSANAFIFLARELRDDEQPASRLSSAEILASCQLTGEQLREVLAIAGDDPLISPAVLLPAIKRSTTSATETLVLSYLADALKAGWRPSESELNAILESISPQPSETTKSIRESHRQAFAGQRARLEGFEFALSGGDRERGRRVFYGKTATCSACHRVAGEGGQVGPDLTKIGAVRSGRDLLESLILPSATIAQGYDSYLVTTSDGRNTTGVIARESSDVLIMRDSSGAEVRVLRGQIEGMTRAATSIMPEGLERPLTQEELRDLLAFLQSLK